MKRVALTISDIPGIMCILALCATCFVNSAFASTDALMISAKKQKKIGTEMYEKMMAEGAAYDNQALQDYVDRIGQSLVANSDRPSLEFTFTVLDNPDINGAFIGKVAKELCERLDEDEIEGMMDALAKVSEVEGKGISFKVFDAHFQGGIGELYAWFAFALQVQFGNFGRAWNTDLLPSLQAKPGSTA